MALNSAPFIFSAADGRVLTPVGQSSVAAQSVVVLADGRLLVGGYASGGSNIDFAVARYNADGSLDTTFGTNGRVLTAIGSASDIGLRLLVQPDGKIVLAGYGINGSTTDFAVARYNADGSLDTGFGSGGKLLTPVGAGSDAAYGAVLQADGKIILAGASYNGSNNDFALVRYNANGTLDAGFGTGGKATLAVGSGDDTAQSVTLDAAGRIIVAGYSKIGGDYDFAIARYNANGTLDTSFSGDGKQIYHFGGAANDLGYDVKVQADGKLVVAGYTGNGNVDMALVRFNVDGSIDTGFGANGKVVTAVGTLDEIARSLVIQPDGKIVVGGYTVSSGTGYNFAVVRYNTDGSLDQGFGTGGKAVTAVGVDGADFGASLALQADGKIVLVGSASGASGGEFGLVRFNADGSVDTTFGATRFTEGGAAAVIDEGVSVLDYELASANNYAGTSLLLTRDGGQNGEDAFGLAGAQSHMKEGGVLIVDGATVGTVIANSAGKLFITFTNASQSVLENALRQITYENMSDAPPDAVVLKWTFSDGNTGAQGTDGTKSASTTSVVHITGVNDAAVIGGEVVKALAETNAALSASGQLSVSDVDSPATFQATTLAGSLGGTLVLQANGSYAYTAASAYNELAAGQTQTDTFTVQSADGTAATVSVQITSTNDAPVAFLLAKQTVKEDAKWSYKLSPFSFFDADSPNLTYSAKLSNGKALSTVGLQFDAATQTFSGRPPQDFNGTIDIKITASDGTATSSNTLLLDVTAVNDAPVITSNKGKASASLSVVENKKAVAALKVSDVDGDKLSWSLSGKDAKLFAINSKTGALAFKATPDFETPKDVGKNNTYDVTVNVTDGKLSDTQALSIKITDVKGKALSGDSKANTLKGTLEADTLTGNKGADKLWGGEGNDRFVFKALSDSTTDKKGQDTVFDFTHGDRFDLSAIDANGKAKGNGAFTFVESTKFHGHAGELRFEKLKSDTLVYADVNGDKHADFAFHLDDAVKLVKADFLL